MTRKVRCCVSNPKLPELEPDATVENGSDAIKVVGRV